MKKGIRYLGWAIVWLTSLFFIQNGVQKLVGSEQMVEMFDELGYPDMFRLFVGSLELIGGILLAIPKSTLYGATGLAIVMTGAVFSELRAGHLFESLIPTQWLIVFVIIVYIRLRVRKSRNSSGNVLEKEKSYLSK